MENITKNIKEINENYIIEALKNSDRKMYKKLFYFFYPTLCTYCNKFVSFEDSEEITQDTLLWLWDNRQNLSIEKNLSSYLFKSVYNRALNKISSIDCRNKANTIYYEQMQERLQDNTYHQTDDLKDIITNSIAKLPSSYKQAFIMHRFKDMTYKEIADKLGVSNKTVDYRIQKSLKLLKEDLKDTLTNYHVNMITLLAIIPLLVIY